MDEHSWYAELRSQNRPERVRLLLVGESAPSPSSTAAERRFFYAPVLDRRDNLFRGVVQALYDTSPGRAGDPKGPWLDRLKQDGVFLIDLVPYPVDKLSRRERALARRTHASACADAVKAADPAGVIVCHGPSFDALAPALGAIGAPLLHDEPIPFPIGNWRSRFIENVRSALGGLPEGMSVGSWKKPAPI